MTARIAALATALFAGFLVGYVLGRPIPDSYAIVVSNSGWDVADFAGLP